MFLWCWGTLISPSPYLPGRTLSLPCSLLPAAPFPGKLPVSCWVGARHLLDQVHSHSQEQHPCVGQVTWAPLFLLTPILLAGLYSRGSIPALCFQNLCVHRPGHTSARSTQVCVLSLPVIDGKWTRAFLGLHPLQVGRGSWRCEGPRHAVQPGLMGSPVL